MKNATQKHKWLPAVMLMLVFCCAHAGNPYHNYLLGKAFAFKPYATRGPALCAMDVQCYPIPRYEIPKGNVFCRMEDKLTKATGIWIKVGVK